MAVGSTYYESSFVRVNPSTSADFGGCSRTAGGGIGMMTCGVQNMRYGRGNGGRLFECRGETVGNVKMEPIAAKIVGIAVAANQENCCRESQHRYTTENGRRRSSADIRMGNPGLTKMSTDKG
jgi:hypothetical protein